MMFGLELFKASGSCRCLGIVVMVGIKNRCSSSLRMTSGSSHRLNAQHDIITYNSATAFLVNIPGMDTNFWSSFLSLVISLHNWMSSILTNKINN